MHHRTRSSPYVVAAGLILLAIVVFSGCSAGEQAPISRALFEQHLLGGLPLGCDPGAFEAEFGELTCGTFAGTGDPPSHEPFKVCKPAPGIRQATRFTIPDAGPVEATHFEAVFVAERLMFISYQFFLERDYRRVDEGLEAVLGKPSAESTRRVSGLLGPTINKTHTRVWQAKDDTLELRSDPGGNGISVLKFAAAP